VAQAGEVTRAQRGGFGIARAFHGYTDQVGEALQDVIVSATGGVSAAADAGDDFRSDQAGVVVGIDTAEQF
jgi:hypothetical protein